MPTNNYDVKTYQLGPLITPVSLPSSRAYAVISASVNAAAISIAFGDGNADFAAWPSGFIIEVEAGKKLTARLTSSVAQTVVVAFCDGGVRLRESRANPGNGTIPVSAALAQFVDGSIVALGATTDNATGSDGANGTLISHLKRLVSKFGTLGQKAMAASAPVVIANDQSAVPYNLTQILGQAVVAAGVNGVQAVGGRDAVGAAIGGTANPNRIAGQTSQTGVANLPNYAADTIAGQAMTGDGAAVIRPFGASGQAAVGHAQMINTTPPTILAAPGANLRYLIHSITISGNAGHNCDYIEVGDTANADIRTHLPAGAFSIHYPIPGGIVCGVNLAVNAVVNTLSSGTISITVHATIVR